MKIVIRNETYKSNKSVHIPSFGGIFPKNSLLFSSQLSKKKKEKNKKKKTL